MSFTQKERFLIFLSFACTYIVWGSTYFANAEATDEIPPFLMAGSRFLAAGGLMWIFARFTNQYKISQRQLINCAISGFLFITCGVGLTVWAQLYVASGITALIIALEPLLIVFMLWIWNKERPIITSFIGVIFGVLGAMLLFSEGTITTSANAVLGVAMIFVAITCWGFSMVFVSKKDMPDSKIATSSYQMLFGSVFLFLFSLAFDDTSNFSVSNISTNGWLAMGFLIFFGAILAFTAYNYLLSIISPEKVATNTYVNPIIAMILGYWFRDEPLTQISIIAACLMLIGVFFINSGEWILQKLRLKA